MHIGQLVPGTEIPYINHLANVAMEAMSAIALSHNIKQPDLLVQCALLHDTIEDTACSYEDIKLTFGTDIADNVAALSKNKALATKEEQMQDSLQRIQQQAIEISMVKLRDRITNLQPPPSYWKQEKIAQYQKEAILILNTLAYASTSLTQRLQVKINHYKQYL
jgi:(p)ppGpp synthase/HD superfamily hydrolase